MGNFQPTDESFTQYFERQEPLVGFVGYEHNRHDSVSAFGLIKFMCMPPPVEEEEPIGTDEEAETIVIEREVEVEKITVIETQSTNGEASGFITGAIALLAVAILVVGIALCL